MEDKQSEDQNMVRNVATLSASVFILFTSFTTTTTY